MSLESLGINLRIKLVLATSWFIENTAKLLGYPKTSQGMPIVDDPNAIYGLPLHQPRVPPSPDPTNMLEAIFGNVPKSSVIEKFYYESARDGYYNFYIEHYRNVIFLPDWLSKWIQLHFTTGIDTANLEIIRDTLFSLSIYFMFFLQFRTMLYYFITINPYTRPWVYLISLSDWIYDILFHLGITRRATFFGFPILSIIVNGVAGVIADALNHLVFTMPFLPSEGEAGKVLIDGVPKDVIMFRYLPSLWFSHPIPDKLREFWYLQRPDIYKFMKNNYGHLDIDFLPNKILRQIYESEQNHLHSKSLVNNAEKIKILSTHVFCNSTIWLQEWGNTLSYKQDILLSSFLEHNDKLI